MFLFFKKRKRPLSFLSRRKNGLLLFFLEEKKQKKIKFGRVASLFFCRFRQRGIQNGRFVCEPSVFSFRAGRAGKHLFSDKSTIPQCLLFLFFKKRKRPLSFLSRRKNGLLLFFLEEKKQKKIKFGRVASLFFCRFRQRGIQNGRFVCEPSVFSFRAGRAGKHLFSDKSTIPQCLLFLFFKKRKRTPFKKRKRTPFKKRNRSPSKKEEALLGLPPANDPRSVQCLCCEIRLFSLAQSAT